ncbi:hypothetical protein M0812_05583 [Anaeramoeba flamelloides]|uniref:Transmembrane protein n=1 Tax=Anaeramoeba flamelloides TaxID=1746091 RepID=A0AAV8A732_9EUKA|nr:hypothetical protein M0812_05583 [Anaeramoeba flamelloides]
MIQNPNRNKSKDPYGNSESYPLLDNHQQIQKDKKKKKIKQKRIVFIIVASIVLVCVIFCLFFFHISPQNYCFGFTERDPDCNNYTSNYETFQFPITNNWFQLGQSTNLLFKQTHSWEIQIRDHGYNKTVSLTLEKGECYTVFRSVDSEKLCNSQMIARFDSCYELNSQTLICQDKSF